MNGVHPMRGAQWLPTGEFEVDLYKTEDQPAGDSHRFGRRPEPSVRSVEVTDS